MPEDGDDANSTTQTMDIESLRLQLSIVVAHLKNRVSLETLKPLPEFLGLTSTAEEGLQLSSRAYNSPSLARGFSATIWSRIKDNSNYFTTNYCLVAAMVALVVTLMHPSMLLVVGLVVALWWCHGYLIKHEVVVAGVPIHAVGTIQQRFYFLLAISFVLVVWFCLVPTFLFASLSGFIILTHATLRDTTHLHEASDRGSKNRGDEEEAFLNNSKNDSK